jgi:hypothetical protein
MQELCTLREGKTDPDLDVPRITFVCKSPILRALAAVDINDHVSHQYLRVHNARAALLRKMRN